MLRSFQNALIRRLATASGACVRPSGPLLFLVIAVAASAYAQQGGASADAATDQRLRAHVAYLASDKLEGRRTGTAGAGFAARYIAAEFERYGLRPGGAEKGLEKDPLVSRYLQQFPYVASVELGKNNAMTLAPGALDQGAALDLRLKEDWMPLGWSANGRVENAPAAFVGYGIKAADLNYDDYAGVESAGRVAIAFAGTPDGDNPHGPFARYAELRFKAAAARDHGARALVLIAREEDFQDERLARLRYDHNASDASLPVVVISRQAARHIFKAGGLSQSLDELEKQLRTGTFAGGPDAGPSAARRAFSLNNVALTIETDVVRRTAPAANVIGILDGADPRLRDEVVVIGAHYDHLGRGGSGSLAPREGDIHYGADDNASGTAALLELARQFAGGRNRLRRTLIFIAFGGEEEGLIGSNYYVNHPVAPLAQTVAMINMDMIGRLRDDRLLISGVGTAREWRDWIAQTNAIPQAASHLGAEESQRMKGAPVTGDQPVATASARRFALALNEDGFGPSDHSAFYAKQVPVLFFFTGTHEDYHKPSDTADKLNYRGLARIADFVRDLVIQIDAAARPTYALVSGGQMGRSTGFRVYLGTVPNYAETNDGVKLDAVREGSPAARAGLKAGDRIVRMAGRDVRNVYDYTYALGEMKAGQEYEMEVVRAGERLTLKITPAPRR
jgi:hypothetical protein